MENIKGKIMDGSNIIAENVDMVITESPPSSKLKSWQGSFKLPSNLILETGVPLKLILEDGRSGKIFVRNIKSSSESKRYLVVFIGSGPLK